MKTTFVGKFPENFLLKITKNSKEEYIPISAFEYSLIGSWMESEIITLYGENLAAILPNPPATDEIVKKKDFVFDADLVELKEDDDLDLIAEMKNVMVVGTKKSGDKDTVYITVDHFCWGLFNRIGRTMEEIHKKNLETWQETKPDYSDLEDW